MIRTENVSLIYNQPNSRLNALSGISMQLSSGSSMAIIGPSGCGKSSLLFLLAGLKLPSTGNVSINGENLAGPCEDTALILQDYGLFPWKTVYDNACLGLHLRGINNRVQKETVEPILKRLGLFEFIHHYPSQLSGGQRQRVAIARSLAIKPKILLMDEPLSSLDALTRENLQGFITDIWQENKLTLVLVTHSIEEAVFLGRKIAVMSERPGTILETIDNPLAGSAGYRQKPEYHAFCTRLRRLLGVER